MCFEHLHEPLLAVDGIRDALRPGGRALWLIVVFFQMAYPFFHALSAARRNIRPLCKQLLRPNP